MPSFFDTRIVRTTELLLFLSRCYSRLDVSDDTRVGITIRHGGLEGRHLRSASTNRMLHDRDTREDLVESSTTCSVGELQSQLVQQVRALLEPLFTVFDFMEISDPIWSEIIDGFVEGEMR
jgi:hypothetical protein